MSCGAGGCWGACSRRAPPPPRRLLLTPSTPPSTPPPPAATTRMWWARTRSASGGSACTAAVQGGWGHRRRLLWLDPPCCCGLPMVPLALRPRPTNPPRYSKGSSPKGRNVFLKNMEPFMKWCAAVTLRSRRAASRVPRTPRRRITVPLPAASGGVDCRAGTHRPAGNSSCVLAFPYMLSASPPAAPQAGRGGGGHERRRVSGSRQPAAATPASCSPGLCTLDAARPTPAARAQLPRRVCPGWGPLRPSIDVVSMLPRASSAAPSP